MRVPVKVRTMNDDEEVGGRKRRKHKKRGGTRKAIREQRRDNRQAQKAHHQQRKLERLQERGEKLRAKTPSRGQRRERPARRSEPSAPASPGRPGPARHFPGEGPPRGLRRPKREDDEQLPQEPENEPPEEAEEWPEPAFEEEEDLSDIEESDAEEEDPELTEEEVGAFPIRVRRAPSKIVKHGKITAYAPPGNELVVIPLSADCAIVSAWSDAKVRELGVEGLARVAIEIAQLKLSGAEVAVGEDEAGFVPLAVYLVSQGIKAVKKATQEAAPAEPASVETEVGRRPPKRRGAKPAPRRVGDSCGCDACRRGRRGQR